MNPSSSKLQSLSARVDRLEKIVHTIHRLYACRFDNDIRRTAIELRLMTDPPAPTPSIKPNGAPAPHGLNPAP